VGVCAAFASAWVLAACQPSSAPRPYTGVEQSERYVGASPNASQPGRAPEPVVASVGAEQIRASDLRPGLYELRGAVALEEAVLDLLVARELERAGIEITRGDIDAERDALFETLTESAENNPERAGQLLRRIRADRGLGEHRFEALLRRNASLRALVADGIEISEEDIERAYEVVHGRRYELRLITVETQAEAQEVRDSLASDESDDRSDLSIRFAELAARRSTDPSAARGGLVGVISPADARLPAALRRAVRSMNPGEVSPVIALDRGYALAMIERVVPRSGVSLEEARPVLVRDLRQREERRAMSDLAGRLLDRAEIRPIDPHLDWSWRNRARGPENRPE